jgi:hypothetical protein
MKMLLAATFIVGAGLIAAVPSQATPPAPAHAVGGTAIVRVIQGCGPNGHRGPYGHCRPRYSCPAGWHPARYGWHCFRN